MEAERKEKQEEEKEDARKQVTKKLFSFSSSLRPTEPFSSLSLSLSVSCFWNGTKNVFALNLFQTAERVPLERSVQILLA